MKVHRLAWLVAVLLAGATVPALAGRKTTASVTVSTANRTASGSLGSARNSTDSNQLIGCVFTTYFSTDPATTEPPFRGFNCFARTSTGTQAGCARPFVNQVEPDILASLAEDAFIRFTWDAQGLCTSIRIENYSYYAPVQP